MTDEEIKLDLMRSERVGFGEAIFCQQKSIAQIGRILALASDAGTPLLLTRLSETQHTELLPRFGARLDYDAVSETAFFDFVASGKSTDKRVVIVAAGTSDAGPAREALRTLAFNEVSATAILDVGVAGLWRLMERLEEVRQHDVIIAVAGMDAALVSVLGGLVAQPLIAVPTSTGYGAARGGETALAASLVSCAAGVTVCNIDNGYGAACAALRILGRDRRR
jgi:NCAIR mutase (PurE)-related protein